MRISPRKSTGAKLLKTAKKTAGRVAHPIKTFRAISRLKNKNIKTELYWLRKEEDSLRGALASLEGMGIGSPPVFLQLRAGSRTRSYFLTPEDRGRVQKRLENTLGKILKLEDRLQKASKKPPKN